ncbi:adenylate/guanylate cyclase domain-containing protein [Bizionia paragorgiae]|uniref:Adenylate cyclase n=1 Tax=Bizionia paragorgiae TaxID=283786 RepID=A0A1H4DBQ1_BIZPA|nr:adenylate/guanylate cyclase domain-containing protein [Bizionia paragorgiae]MDX1270807.1 adenylate/guanylate cyclase domain-containing protein [Bizionia paragorgiae]SEA69702.1 adenylate cyclase [Bizionia paragorgiae]
MKPNFIKFFKLLSATILFWSFAFCLFIFIRYHALGEEEGIDNGESLIKEILYLGVILGSIIGTLFAVVEYLYDNYLSKNLSLGVVLLQKSIIYLIGLIAALSYVFRLVEATMDLNLDNDEIGWWQTNQVFWLVVAYFIIWSLIFSFFKIANDKFGSGVFFNFLIGKYRKPREEKRVFMFLDLQASTTIAEKLGHFKYSELIQDCFFDLNRIVGKYNAQIYQYVGDEAVLSWDYKNGIKNNNCLEIFFHFDHRIEKRAKYYTKKYGLTPTFKAGVHGGKLIVTEVGSVKKEIAYHGDVINTTARIQGECNKYKEYLLCSNELLVDLILSDKLSTRFIGDLQLKGKEETLKISAVHKK